MMPPKASPRLKGSLPLTGMGARCTQRNGSRDLHRPAWGTYKLSRPAGTLQKGAWLAVNSGS